MLRNNMRENRATPAPLGLTIKAGLQLSETGHNNLTCDPRNYSSENALAVTYAPASAALAA